MSERRMGGGDENECSWDVIALRRIRPQTDPSILFMDRERDLDRPKPYAKKASMRKKSEGPLSR